MVGTCAGLCAVHCRPEGTGEKAGRRRADDLCPRQKQNPKPKMAFASLPPVLQPSEDDIQKMLAAQVHIGTQNSDFMMAEYIWRRRQDGIHIINIGQTWEKLMLAARIIVAIENP